MKRFKLPDITPPEHVHTLADARDALDRANRELCNAAICLAALEQASAELAATLGRLLAVAETGRLDLILPTARAVRKQYDVDHFSERTH